MLRYNKPESVGNASMETSITACKEKHHSLVSFQYPSSINKESKWKACAFNIILINNKNNTNNNNSNKNYGWPSG